jgi:hypothetical protein
MDAVLGCGAGIGSSGRDTCKLRRAAARPTTAPATTYTATDTTAGTYTGPPDTIAGARHTNAWPDVNANADADTNANSNARTRMTLPTA